MNLLNRLSRSVFVRYVVVGVVNTAFSFSVYLACVWVGMAAALASLVSLLIGIVFSFKTQGAFVFLNRDPRLFLRFVAVWSLVYVFNIGMIYGLMSTGQNASVAGALALAPTMLVSFVLQRRITFGGPADAPDSRVSGSDL